MANTLVPSTRYAEVLSTAPVVVPANCPQKPPPRSRAVESTIASSRRATVIVEEPAQTLSSANAVDLVLHRGCTLDQLVTQALMVAHAVIVPDESFGGDDVRRTKSPG